MSKHLNVKISILIYQKYTFVEIVMSIYLWFDKKKLDIPVGNLVIFYKGLQDMSSYSLVTFWLSFGLNTRNTHLQFDSKLAHFTRYREKYYYIFTRYRYRNETICKKAEARRKKTVFWVIIKIIKNNKICPLYEENVTRQKNKTTYALYAIFSSPNLDRWTEKKNNFRKNWKLVR